MMIQMVVPIAATAWELAQIAKDDAFLAESYTAARHDFGNFVLAKTGNLKAVMNAVMNCASSSTCSSRLS